MRRAPLRNFNDDLEVNSQAHLWSCASHYRILLTPRVRCAPLSFTLPLTPTPRLFPSSITTNMQRRGIPTPYRAHSRGPIWDAVAAAEQVEAIVSTVEDATSSLDTSDMRKATWAGQADDVRQYALDQEAKICFVGVAGGGKSSMLNALLGMDVVPTSGKQACTASPLRIEYHDSSVVSAQVTFLSRAEWMEELCNLFPAVLDEHGRIKTSEEIGKDGTAALQKLRVLCPSMTNEQIERWGMNPELFIEQNPDVHRHLGHTLSIEGTDAQAFQANISPFASSKDIHRGMGRRGKRNDSEPQAQLVWPLVRLISLRCNAVVLSTGAILLDLPGAGDSNRARVQVAEKWMKECKFVFIVAPIQRAVDDKIARDLLGDAFRYQMLMDGRYDNRAITMLATKCDDVSAAEIIRELSLRSDPDFDDLCVRRDEVEEEFRELEELKTTIEEKGLIMDYDDYIAHSTLKKELDALERDRDAYCAKQRSAWIINAAQQDFRQGLYDIDGAMAEHRDPTGFDPSARTRDYSNVNLPVFTCSARDYMRLCGLVPGDSKRTTFSIVEDTGVPGVTHWIQTLTYSDRDKRAVRKLELGRVYCESVRNFCQQSGDNDDGSNPEHQSGDASALAVYGSYSSAPTPEGRTPASTAAQVGQYLSEELITLAKASASTICAQIKQILADVLMSGADRSVDAAVEVFRIWANSLHWQTLRAAFRGCGEYRGRTGSCDLNWAESESMLKHIAGTWHLVFSAHSIAPLAQSAKGIIDEAFGMVPESIGKREQCRAVHSACHDQARVAFEGLSDSSSLLLTEGQRDASRLLKPSIQKSLCPAYTRALGFYGKGSVQKQKDSFAKYLDRAKSNMFHKAGHEMLRRLDEATDELAQSLVDAMKRLAEQVELNMYTLWECGTIVDTRQVEARRRVFELTTRLIEQIDLWLQAAARTSLPNRLSRSLASLSVTSL